MSLGSLHDQPKSHTDKDGFLLHTRLGLVGWIAYWCNGDSALAVDVVVALINMLDLKELVSVALAGTKYVYRLAKCGQLRRRLTCVLDTFGSASLGRFLVA